MLNPSTSPARLDRCRLALLPAAPAADPAACRAALMQGGADFLDFVLAQDLGPLWHHCLQRAGLLAGLPGAWVEALRAARMAAALAYLPQRAALAQIDPLFAAQGISYLVMKGVYVRECAYPDPALRAAGDIDILIAPRHRRQAAQALLGSGYTVHVLPNNVSHEATFSRGGVDIDLHWHMQRPGRTRGDMTDGLLERRQQTNGVWGACRTDALFMMLTHPAFSKYVCSPHMGLARVADFLLLMQHQDTDWPAVLQQLQAQGLKAAAWTMLSWFRMLAQPGAASAMDEWLAALRPGPLRSAYLRFWLTHDLPTRWLQRPRLIQVGFTLLMHDRPADALHAVQGHLRARPNRLRDARLLLGDAYRWSD